MKMSFFAKVNADYIYKSLIQLRRVWSENVPVAIVSYNN